MDDPLGEFLRCLAVERQANPTTLRNYRSDIASALTFAADRGETAVSMTRDTVRAWLAERLEALSSATRRRQLSALRSFFGWMVASNLRCSNPTTEVRGPRREWRLPRVLSVEDVTRLLEAPAGSSPADVRARAILELLYGSGLRVSELRALNASHVTMTTGELRVLHGKGHKDRVVYIGTGALRALRAWLPLRQQLVHAAKRYQPALFVNFRDAARLDTRSIARIVRDAGRRAGIPRVHPHLLRHCFATHLIDRGADILTVSKLLGHESVLSTQVYTRLATSRLATVIRERHPRG